MSNVKADIWKIKLSFTFTICAADVIILLPVAVLPVKAICKERYIIFSKDEEEKPLLSIRTQDMLGIYSEKSAKNIYTYIVSM